MSNAPEPRAEVVEDLYLAIREHDDELLATVNAAIPGPTSAEWDEATDLLVADKISEILGRRTEVMVLLAAQRWPGGVTWESMLADLPSDVVARLSDLYDDMPPGAQTEYDRLYGRGSASA